MEITLVLLLVVAALVVMTLGIWPVDVVANAPSVDSNPAPVSPVVPTTRGLAFLSVAAVKGIE